MSDYVQRVVGAGVASVLVPARARARLLRKQGFTAGARLVMHAGAHLGSTRISFGDDVFVNVGLFYDGNGPVTVGDRVALGPNVQLVTATHGIGSGSQRCDPEPVALPVTVEDGCWVGASVTVLPGVTIREGCVVAAGAVVTKSTEPHGLYAGVPARRARNLPV